MSAAALGSLITTICLATSGFFAVFFKGMSHSRCTKINMWFRIMTFPQQWFRTRRRAVVHILFHSPCTSYFRLSSTTARKAASAFHFLPSFSPLSSPSTLGHVGLWLLRTPGVPLGGLPVLPLPPLSLWYRVISASFYFVRTEPRARHAPLVFRKRLTSPSSYWAVIAPALRMGPSFRFSFRLYRNFQDLSSQKPLHSIQLQEGCLDPNLVLEPTALDLADLTSATTTSTFRTHPPAAVRVSGW